MFPQEMLAAYVILRRNLIQDITGHSGDSCSMPLSVSVGIKGGFFPMNA